MAVISKVNEKTGQPADLKRIPKKVLDKEDFIQLFVKQLQYQNPMKPIENHEMALQLASFNQVDQLMNINDKLSKLVDLYKANEYTLYANLVGKLVKVEGNVGRIEGGSFLGGEFNLSEPANEVIVTIRNEKGQLVRTIEMKNLPKGKHQINWDGLDNTGQLVPDGNYRISVAVIRGENRESLPVTVVSKVTGAIIGDQPKLVINGSEKVTLRDIKEILGG